MRDLLMMCVCTYQSRFRNVLFSRMYMRMHIIHIDLGARPNTHAHNIVTDKSRIQQCNTSRI